MTNTVIPIPIIVPVDHTPDKCPKCGQDEQRVEVCAHCGYRYTDEPVSTISIILFLAGVIIIPMWALITIFQWVFGYHNETLVDILQVQAQWVAELAGRVI